MTTVAAEAVARPGYLAGFASLEDEVEIDRLQVEGDIPPWLTGKLLRNGPAKFEAGDQPLRHWFDGQAMLHRFSFAEGGRVSYANRFLRTAAYREIEAGRVSFREFGTDPARSVLKRATGIFRPNVTDNCNVNLVRLGDEYVAMTETSRPVSFDPETLDCRAAAFAPPGLHTTAHPHVDPVRGELISFATHFWPRGEYRIYAQSERGQRLIASHQVCEPSYMHSFAMTERFVVLVAFPLVVNPLRLGFGPRPFIENYQWKPELGTQVLVFSREQGDLRASYEAEPCFGTHHVNAFERDGELVVDFVAYDDAHIIDALYLERLRTEAPPEGAGRLQRYRLPLGGGPVVEERIGEPNLDLPRIAYQARNTRPYRYVYGAGVHRDESLAPDFLNQLVKIDVESGEDWTWWEPGAYPGEPVFVPDPERADAEDGGVLLSVVLDGRSASSYLLILDAARMAELGRAWVPHHIPFGFHGKYFV